jgi:hypothetical protein
MSQFLGTYLYRIGVWFLIQSSIQFRKEDVKNYPDLANCEHWEYVRDTICEDVRESLIDACLGL